MKNYNLIIIEGNLVKDPEIKKNKNGNTIIRFIVANNGYGTKKDTNLEPVSFFDIIYWSESNSFKMDMLRKGVGVRIIGSLSQWRWQNEGKNRSKVHIIAKNIDFLSRSKVPKFI